MGAVRKRFSLGPGDGGELGVPRFGDAAGVGQIRVAVACSSLSLFRLPCGVPDAGTPLSDRLIDAVKMLVVAGGICWGSGWIFHRWDLTVGIKNSSIVSTLPMKVFWWALALLFVLFGLSAYFEYYYMPLRMSLLVVTLATGPNISGLRGETALPSRSARAFPALAPQFTPFPKIAAPSREPALALSRHAEIHPFPS